MAGIRLLGIHRSWEDWFGMLLGVLIGLSPWLADQAAGSQVMWNAIIVGALVLMFAELELVSLRRWEEILSGACGLWLIASPYAFQYSGALATWHYALGGIVVLLALFELWQDWRLNDRELAQHGQ
jgi:hypothetical protein